MYLYLKQKNKVLQHEHNIILDMKLDKLNELSKVILSQSIPCELFKSIISKREYIMLCGYIQMNDEYGLYNVILKSKNDIKKSDVLKYMKKYNINPNDLKVDEFIKGIIVELEHGSAKQYGGSSDTNVTNNRFELTANIALAHFKEGLNYYKYLEEAEELLEKEKKKEPSIFLKK